jgi:hypothetical protein
MGVCALGRRHRPRARGRGGVPTRPSAGRVVARCRPPPPRPAHTHTPSPLQERQTKPEGQIHFFPVIFNGKQLYDVMIERCGPTQNSGRK